MKKILLLVPVIAMLAACGTTRDAYERRADAERDRQEQYVKNAINQAPEWMTKIPLSNSAVYEAGTGVSTDFSFADHKAKADAYGKICMLAGGTASQKTKVYRLDSTNATSEASEMALITKCDSVDLTGAEIREIKRIAEGNRFRVYVLVALPTGDANLLRKAKEQAKLNDVATARAPEAFKELEKGNQ